MIRRNFISGSLASLAAFFGLSKATAGTANISADPWVPMKSYAPGTVLDVPADNEYVPPAALLNCNYFIDLSYSIDGEAVKKVGGFQTLEEMIAFMKVVDGGAQRGHRFEKELRAAPRKP